LKLVIGAALTATLVACGGGGDSGPAAPVVSTETFALKNAYVNFVNDNRSLQYAISGTTKNIAFTGSGNIFQSSLTATTFEGKPALAKTVTVTGSLVVNGTTAPLNDTQVEYFDTSYNPLGSSASEYEVVVGAVNIPETGKVGATGIVYTAKRYQSSAKTVQVGTNVTSYTLEPDTASTAILRWIDTEKDNSGNQTASSTVLYRITTTGSITRLSETYVDSDGNLVATYK
jgi:hypothetical protein